MRPTIEWRHGNDPERDDLESDLAAISEFDETETIQDAPDADINALIKRFGINDGSILPANLGVTDPRYFGDWDPSIDMRVALDRARIAEQHFMALPADIRSRFNNSSLELYKWAMDPKNEEEAYKLKLLAPKPIQAPPGGTEPQPTGG